MATYEVEEVPAKLLADALETERRARADRDRALDTLVFWRDRDGRDDAKLYAAHENAKASVDDARWGVCCYARNLLESWNLRAVLS